jgi:hypothetical protein
MTVVYSLVPYKTPWCLLSFYYGLILLAGLAVQGVLKRCARAATRVAVWVLLLAGASHLGRQASLAAGAYCADPRNPYVYVQTSRDFLKLVERVKDLAGVHDDGYSMLIVVVADRYATWPLPWYLRAFRRVGYWNETDELPDVSGAPVLIGTPELIERLPPEVLRDYQREYYGLRPGVLQVLCVRRPLWEAFLETRRMRK